MPSLKLTQLTSAVTPAASTDLLYLVDATPTSHYITLANTLRSVPSGTEPAPGLAFGADQDCGLYRYAADRIGVSGSLEFANNLDYNAVYINSTDPDASDFCLWVIGGLGNPGDPTRDNLVMFLGYNGYTGGVIDAAEYRLHTVWETNWNPGGTAYFEHYPEVIAPAGSGGASTRPYFITVSKTAALVTDFGIWADVFRLQKTGATFTAIHATLGATLAASGMYVYCNTLLQLTSLTAFEVQNAGSTPVFTVDTTNGNAFVGGKLGVGVNPLAYQSGIVSLFSSIGAAVSPSSIQGTVSKYRSIAGEVVYSGQFIASTYADSGNSSVAMQVGVAGTIRFYSNPTFTNTVGTAAALLAEGPLFIGAGAYAITTVVGLYVGNQGNAILANSYGIYIEPQAGSTVMNYAIKTGTGLNYFGDQVQVWQTNPAGAQVLYLNQADDDKPFIRMDGTSAADQAHSISTVNGDGTVEGPKNYSSTAGWYYQGMIRVNMNNQDYWMPFYSPDLS